MTPRSPMLAALERPELWGPAPDPVLRFDAAVAGAGPDGIESGLPDFFESSPQLAGDRLQPWRLSYYFDAPERDAPELRAAWREGVVARLLAAAEGLGVTVPPQLVAALSRPTPAAPQGSGAALRQLCVGLDARSDPAQTRLKLYAIFAGDAESETRALAAALGIAAPEHGRLELTHIAGVDLTRAGVHDLKLYTSMDPRRVPRTLRAPAQLAPLLRGCRRVIYQRSLGIPGKQSYHFHADAPAQLWAELARLRARAPATVELERRRQALAEVGLAPWILAHPFAAGELDRETYSLYLHLSGPGGATG